MDNLLAELPPVFIRPMEHYLKAAQEYQRRDPVVSYYCKLYALQRGLDVDRRSPACRNFLRVLLEMLEQTKEQMKDQGYILEAIQSRLVAQVHIEDVAIKLFFYADTEDRNSRFGRNVVKAFYTSSMLFDVLSTFGDLPEELEKSRKYAKWKAAYIHSCLKNEIEPRPGPLAEALEELGISADYQFPKPSDQAQTSTPQNPMPSSQAGGFYQPPNQPHFMNQPINKVLPNEPSNFKPSSANPANPPSGSHPQPARRQYNFETPNVNEVYEGLQTEHFAKAMEFCKSATKTLQFEDAHNALFDLSKALNILTTGFE